MIGGADEFQSFGQARVASPAAWDAAMTGGLRGVFFILAGMAALATQDMVIKFLSGGYPLH